LWVEQVGLRERDRETETEIFAAGMRFVAWKWREVEQELGQKRV
jgi:hypothetical protein